MTTVDGALLLPKSASAGCFIVCISPKFNLPYFLEEFQSADLQLLSRPETFRIYFLTFEVLVISFGILSFTSCKECGFYYIVSYCLNSLINAVRIDLMCLVIRSCFFKKHGFQDCACTNCIGIFVTPISVILYVYVRSECKPCTIHEKCTFSYFILAQHWICDVIFFHYPWYCSFIWHHWCRVFVT
jgi:hypothetical protein